MFSKNKLTKDDYKLIKRMMIKERNHVVYTISKLPEDNEESLLIYQTLDVYREKLDEIDGKLYDLLYK